METKLEYAVSRATGCWLSLSAPDTFGYGRISYRVNGKRIYKGAHRHAYETMVGPLPAGMQLDHLCRNRLCINPKHLDVVTQAENIRRGNTGADQKGIYKKTHCKRGHDLENTENVYFLKRGERVCRICSSFRSAKARGE